jgi:hypothetical protein
MVGPIWLQPPCPHAIKHVQRVSVLSSISNGVQEELKSLSVLLFRLFQVLHDHRRHGAHRRRDKQNGDSDGEISRMVTQTATTQSPQEEGVSFFFSIPTYLCFFYSEVMRALLKLSSSQSVK